MALEETVMYIVVVGKEGSSEIEMRPFVSAEATLKFVSSIGNPDPRGHGKDPRYVIRIFSVDAQGNKTDREVVFRGTLKLEPVVKEAGVSCR